MQQVTTTQIQSKLGGIKVLLAEVNDLAKQLRQDTDDPDLYDRELETIASELGFGLSKLFGKALEVNTDMRLLVENAQDELEETHAIRTIRDRRAA